MAAGKRRDLKRNLKERRALKSSGGEVANEKVLVVEDDHEIRDLILLHLRREGLEVAAVGSVEEAEPLIHREKFAVLILDWMLPGRSGIEIARDVRRDPAMNDVGILMVTARAEAADIVTGLDAGADDYLTKPFESSILIARVRALIRRYRRAKSPETEEGTQVVRVGELALYPETFAGTCQDVPLQLTVSEFKLLLTLMQNRGRVLTRESLISHVQGENISVVGRTVDTHVFGLRKKLGACADLIETVRGVGYRVKSGEEG